MSDRDDSRFIRGTVLVFLGLTVGYGSEFGARILVARHLPVGGYGTVVLGSTLLALVGTVSVFGLPIGLSREIPRHDSPSDLFTGSLVFSVVVGAAVSVGLLAATDPLVALFDVAESRTLLQLFVAVLPFLVFLEMVVGGFRGVEDALGRVLIKSVALRFVRFGAVLLAVAAGLETVHIGVVWVCPVVLAAVLAGVLLWTRTDLLSASAVRGRRFGPIRELYMFSFPVMIAFVLNNLVQQIDTLMIGVFWTTNSVGMYDSAFTLGRMFILFSVGFGFLFLPRFSDMDAADDSAEMARFYGQVSKWMTHLAMPVLFVVVALPDTVLTLVFGARYTTASTAFVLVASGFFIHTLLGPNMLGLIAVGRQRTVLVGSVLAFVGNVVLNAALIPVVGIVGAALASLTAFLSFNAYWTVHLHRAIGARPLVRPVVLPAVGTAPVFAIAVTALPAVVGSAVSLLVAAGVVAVSVHLCSVVLLGGFQESDIGWVTSLASWLPIREATVEHLFTRYVLRT